MDNAAAIIGAGIALIGVLISTLIAWAISRKTAYLNTVTVERSKWIEKLRTNIAGLAGLCAYVHYKISTSTAFDKSPECDKAIHDIEVLCAVIQLQLNPHGVIDKNIIEIVQRIYSLSTKKRDYRVFTAQWLLIAHAQWLLKEEWETVKSEAAGFIKKGIAKIRKCWRAAAYRKFCAGDGSLRTLVDDEELAAPQAT